MNSTILKISSKIRLTGPGGEEGKKGTEVTDNMITFYKCKKNCPQLPSSTSELVFTRYELQL